MKSIVLIFTLLFLASCSGNAEPPNEVAKELNNESSLDSDKSVTQSIAEGPCRTNCIEQRNDCLDNGGATAENCDKLYDACVNRCD